MCKVPIRGAASLLDLDTVAWEPNKIAAARPADAAAVDVQAFCTVDKVLGCGRGDAVLELVPRARVLKRQRRAAERDRRTVPTVLLKRIKT